MKEYKWMRLDTPSIMFSSLSTKTWGRTCRLAVVFKEHEIDEALLRQAATDLRQSFPHFYSKLKKGFFWNYLEQTNGLPEIHPETGRPGQPIVLHTQNTPDFRLVYSGRRLAVEGAHHLSDGYGLLTFLLSLTQHYLELAGVVIPGVDPSVRYWKTEVSADELEDSFLRCGESDAEPSKQEEKEVYHFAPVYEKDFLQLVYYIAPSKQIIERARSLALTLTEYMTAVYMLAIIRAEKEPIRKPIDIDIPVNLRSIFDASTLRNFVYQVSTVLPTDGRQDWTLAEIADVLRGQIKAQIAPESLRAILKGLTALAKNPVVRRVPNFIKLPVLRAKQASSHAEETSIFTNLGNVTLSDNLTAHIERLEFVNGDTSGYGLPATCSGVSFNGQFVFCSSSCNGNNAVWRELARILSQEGISVRIESSCAQEEEAKPVKADSFYACEDCSVELPANYACCPLCNGKSVLRAGQGLGTAAISYSKEKGAQQPQNTDHSRFSLSAEKVKAFFHV